MTFNIQYSRPITCPPKDGDPEEGVAYRGSHGAHQELAHCATYKVPNTYVFQLLTSTIANMLVIMNRLTIHLAISEQ